MNYSKISVRYAKAVYDIAEKNNITEKVKNDMLLITELFEKVKNFKYVLESPVIKHKTKEKLINDVLKDKITELTRNYIFLIIKNKREEFLTSITRNFIAVYKKMKGIITVELTIPDELNKKIVNDIKQIVENKYKKEVELIKKINPDLIGGFILNIDDKQLDKSVKNQLVRLKKIFINPTFEKKI